MDRIHLNSKVGRWKVARMILSQKLENVPEQVMFLLLSSGTFWASCSGRFSILALLFVALYRAWIETVKTAKVWLVI